MRNTIPILLALAIGMAGCDNDPLSGPVLGDELGDVTVNDITVPYVAIELAADFLGLSVREVWTGPRRSGWNASFGRRFGPHVYSDEPVISVSPSIRSVNASLQYGNHG